MNNKSTERKKGFRAVGGGGGAVKGPALKDREARAVGGRAPCLDGISQFRSVQSLGPVRLFVTRYASILTVMLEIPASPLGEPEGRAWLSLSLFLHPL